MPRASLLRLDLNLDHGLSIHLATRRARIFTESSRTLNSNTKIVDESIDHSTTSILISESTSQRGVPLSSVGGRGRKNDPGASIDSEELA
jgi:hypothetical protein